MTWILILGFIVFFGRWFLFGLQPDAALYAGLSLKVAGLGEAWALSGTPEKFPIYFEHPPYFFQWGARVLNILGSSDGAARAIGGVPGYLAFAVWIFWIGFRWDALTALVAGLMAMTFAHYLKFAATSMLEAPLSLGVVLTFIGAFESFWILDTKKASKLLGVALIFLGLLISTSSKGVAGMGAWGGLFLSAFLALLFSDSEHVSVFGTLGFLGICFFVALAPLAFWAFKMFSLQEWDYITHYALDQVLRSVTSNRGESFHPVSGDKLYYIKMVAKYGWPWCWTVVVGWILAIVVHSFSMKWARLMPFRELRFKGAAWNSLAFFVAFFVPFSFSTYQLPHYLHPAYLPCLTVGALVLVHLLGVQRWEQIFSFWKTRWVLLFALGGFLFYKSQGFTETAHRGEEFFKVAAKIRKIPRTCSIMIPDSETDAYQAESYSLWYWLGHPYHMLTEEEEEQLQKTATFALFHPETGELVLKGACRK